MKKSIALLTLTLLTLSSPATAFETQSRSEAQELNLMDRLGEPIDMRLPTLPPIQPVFLDAFEPGFSLNLRLRELAPETLVLRFELAEALEFYLTADLDSQGVARLDDMDGETYFSAGLELHVTRELSVFIEDYQSASMVMGDEDLKAEPVPSRTWDGHQLTLGLRYALSARFALEGAAVGYALSVSERGEGAGGRVQLAYSF